MTIEELRQRIDLMDEHIVRLLNARAACAIEIGRIKRASGLPIYQGDREAAVLRHVREVTVQCGGTLTEDAVVRLFERIIDEARRLEQVAGSR